MTVLAFIYITLYRSFYLNRSQQFTRNFILAHLSKFCYLIFRNECYTICIRSKACSFGLQIVCHNHIHILWDCQNPTTGKAIPIMKQDLRDMQDIAANALGMERGNPAEQTKKKHIDSGTYKVQQLQAEIKQLKEEKTGLVGKIQDAWKWKGRAKQAEADLEAERTRLTNEINSRDTIIADLKKELQNEKKRADSAYEEK